MVGFSWQIKAFKKEKRRLCHGAPYLSVWGLKQRRSVLFQVKRDRGGVGTTPSSLL